MIEESKMVTIELKPVERKDRWLLWEIEDRVAQRVSPVFCAPSELAIQRQYEDMMKKNEAKEGDFAYKIIGVYDAGVLMALN